MSDDRYESTERILRQRGVTQEERAIWLLERVLMNLKELPEDGNPYTEDYNHLIRAGRAFLNVAREEQTQQCQGNSKTET